VILGRGLAGLGLAGQGTAGHGRARRGGAGQGKGCFQRVASRWVQSDANSIRVYTFHFICEAHMNSNHKHYSWREGLPTGPDVALIRKTWPNPEIGQEIPYADVAKLVGIEIGSERWRTVTDAWRKREMDEGRIIKCILGRAFVVASAEQIIDDTNSTLKRITRSARRQRINLSTIKTTDHGTKAIVDHQARLMHAIEQDARQKRGNMLPLNAAKTIPNINNGEK
jgi:hypothetical protein